MAETHGHGPDAAGSNHQGRLLAVLGLTLAYVLAEVFGGLYTHSLALVADAGHMLTDALGLGMAFAAIRFAQRPATSAKTYGFYRAEILAALVNGVVLFGVAGYILIEAWQRFQAPPAVQALPMLIVACGGVVVTITGARLLHGGAGANLNMRGAFLEVLGDLIGAIGTIIAAVILLATDWSYADPLISAGIGLFILPRAWGLLKSVVDVLLESVPEGLNVDEIRAAICSVPGVTSTHDLHVWCITSGFVAMSGHVQAEGRASEDVLHDVQGLLGRDFHIEHATLQVESAQHMDDGACCTVDPRCLVVGAPTRQTKIPVRL